MNRTRLSLSVLAAMLIAVPGSASAQQRGPAPRVQTPVRATPSPVRSTPSPRAQNPVRHAPVRQAPVRQAPVRQAPVRQAPVRQAPVRQAPVRQAPVRQAPVRQAPVRTHNPGTRTVPRAPSRPTPGARPAPVYRSPQPTPRATTPSAPRATPSPQPGYRSTPRARVPVTPRYATPSPEPRSSARTRDARPAPVRSAPGGSDARRGQVPAAPDYRQRLRDLYARREAARGTDAAKARGEAISRTLEPRYEPKLRSDLDAARPSAPKVGGAATPRPVDAAPITGRYPVPGRTPRPAVGAAPTPTLGGVRATPKLSQRTTPRMPVPAIGASPRTPVVATPGANPGLRTATPRVRPASPVDVNRSRGGRPPSLNAPGGGGRGPRFTDHWSRYNGWSYAGSRRYAYGCYHWTGHYGAFWSRNCNWGWYSYPYLFCGSWYRYWYDCNSSFALYRSSRYPAYYSASWWWPTYCYLPGSWYGYYGFGAFADSYVDWGYSPPTYASAVEVAPEPEPTPAELSSKHVKLGDHYFRQGRYEEAAESYVRALTYAPDDGALHFVLADALFAQGDYHYAAYMIGKGLSLDPGLAEATTDKRGFYGDPSDFDRQVATLREYLGDKPYDAAAWLVLGYNLRFSERSGEAVTAFERVLEIDPGNEEARAFLNAIALPDPTAPAAGAAGEGR